MTTEESLKRKIDTCQDLQSVVKTMKALAAVSIRQYEKAVEALADYNRTVEMGLQILLRNRQEKRSDRSPEKENLGIIIFGSDQGMCGQFNDQIVSYFLENLANISSEKIKILGVI
jgi:F-type H+-transporting ATPase subunit gamma